MDRPIDIPPPEVRAHLPAKLVRKVEEVERLRREVTTAQSTAAEAGKQVREAEDQDRQALADHTRGKRKQAPTLTAPRARESHAETEAKAAVLKVAAKDAERELLALIEEHREACEAALADERGKLGDTIREAARKLAEAERERMAIAALAGWLAAPMRYVPAKYRTTLGPDVRKLNGEPFGVEEMAEAIATEVEPVEPEAMAPEVAGKVGG